MVIEVERVESGFRRVDYIVEFGVALNIDILNKVK